MYEIHRKQMNLTQVEDGEDERGSAYPGRRVGMHEMHEMRAVVAERRERRPWRFHVAVGVVLSEWIWPRCRALRVRVLRPSAGPL